MCTSLSPMSDKYVYFTSPAPSPSPSLSLSPSPSAYAFNRSLLPPLSPPPLVHARSPYACAPLPPAGPVPIQPAVGRTRFSLAVGSVRINPILGLDKNPAIIYDVSLPPSFITTSRYEPLSSLALSQPATQPPLASMTIFPSNLPWPITIPASSPKPGAFVSVSDVVTAIYRTLRLNVTKLEFDSLPSADARHRVNAMYEHRCRRAGERGKQAYEEERQKGLKRIDFLMGRNTFLGLSRRDMSTDGFMLNTI